MSIRSTLRLAPALSAAALILARSSIADVVVVDAAGGGNYTDIQSAVDVASDGDVLLVKSGTYTWFSVTDKALAIVGDSGAVVHVSGGVRIRNLSAGKTLVLENVQSTGSSSSDPHSIYGLYLKSNAGHVRVEGCDFVGVGHAGSDVNGHHAIRIESCSDAALTLTTSRGGGGAVVYNSFGGGLSGAGISAVSSTVTLYDCTVRGGDGDSADPNALGASGGNGGHGALLESGVAMFASGSSFTGGDGGRGGYGLFLAETYGGYGGDGIFLSGGLVHLLNDVTLPGHLGLGGNGPGSLDGENGSPREGVTFVDLAGSSKHMTSPTPVRENTPYTMTFTGTPGEYVALVVSNEADHVLKLAWNGVMLVKAMHPMLSIPIGTIPPGGTLNVPWGAMDLGGLPSKLLHIQPVFVDAQGHRTIGNASSVVTLSHLY